MSSFANETGQHQRHRIKINALIDESFHHGKTDPSPLATEPALHAVDVLVLSAGLEPRRGVMRARHRLARRQFNCRQSLLVFGVRQTAAVGVSNDVLDPFAVVDLPFAFNVSHAAPQKGMSSSGVALAVASCFRDAAFTAAFAAGFDGDAGASFGLTYRFTTALTFPALLV